MLSAAGDDAAFNIRSFECLGACDIAPMASVEGEYVGPLTEADCAQIVADVREGREVLPDKQLRRRPSAVDLPMGDGLPSAGGHAPIAEGPTAAQNDVRGEKDM